MVTGFPHNTLGPRHRGIRPRLLPDAVQCAGGEVIGRFARRRDPSGMLIRHTLDDNIRRIRIGKSSVESGSFWLR